MEKYKTLQEERTEFYQFPKVVATWYLDPELRLGMDSAFYPNAFHRFMQRLLLGIYWRKLP